MVERIYCGGRWTKSRFNSFIKGHLRSATRKWAPIQETKKKARVGRGLYFCNGCKQHVPLTLPNGEEKGRYQNVFVDHIEPVIEPIKGFTTWDEVIDRMFCEEEGLQVLCKSCHDKKTKEERELAQEKKNNDKAI